MEVIALLDKYIEKLCMADTLKKSDLEELIEEVTRVVIEQDELQDLYLNYYNSYGDDDLLPDAKKLKSKLEYKRALLSDKNMKEERKAQAEYEQREIEKLRLQVELNKKGITIQNTNYNENNNTMTVSFNTVRETVNNMTSLPEEEIEEIQKRIDEIEGIVNSKENKSKKWLKAKEVIKWIADKGVDVGLALLPLLLKIS